MNETDALRQIIATLIADGTLTGDNILFEGQPLTIEEPSDHVTEWGGREVPELDEIRDEHEQVRQLYLKAGFRKQAIPTYHVFNARADGDKHFAAELIDDADILNSVQNSFARQDFIRNWLGGVEHWHSHINVYDGKRLVYPDGVVNGAAIVEDHTLWSAWSDPDDMINVYRGEIRSMRATLRLQER